MLKLNLCCYYFLCVIENYNMSNWKTPSLFIFNCEEDITQITLTSTLEKLLIDVDGISALEMARYSNVLWCHPRASSMVFWNFLCS
jgi:hypothetical protein